MAICLEFVVAGNSIAWKRMQPCKFCFQLQAPRFGILDLYILPQNAIITYFVQFPLRILVLGVISTSRVNLLPYYVFEILLKITI